MKKIFYLSTLIIFLFVTLLQAEEKNPTIEKLEGLRKNMDNLKIIYVLEKYPKYHSELSQIREELSKINALNINEGMMNILSDSSILRLMYIYNTEDMLFSIVPNIKESETISYCNFLIQHNEHDRKEIKNIQDIIQVAFDGSQKVETLHQLDKVKRIILDSLELIDMTDGIFEDYKQKLHIQPKK
jgi:hypothetical protein